jgi:hypothetical protein
MHRDKNSSNKRPPSRLPLALLNDLYSDISVRCGSDRCPTTIVHVSLLERRTGSDTLRRSPSDLGAEDETPHTISGVDCP